MFNEVVQNACVAVTFRQAGSQPSQFLINNYLLHDAKLRIICDKAAISRRQNAVDEEMAALLCDGQILSVGHHNFAFAFWIHEATSLFELQVVYNELQTKNQLLVVISLKYVLI